METFGQRLKRFRKERGITQKELAAELGIHHGCISQYETDKVKPTLTRIGWLCEALKVSASELLGF